MALVRHAHKQVAVAQDIWSWMNCSVNRSLLPSFFKGMAQAYCNGLTKESSQLFDIVHRPV